MPSPFDCTFENVDSPSGPDGTAGNGAGNATGGTNTEGTAGAGPDGGGVDTAAGTGPEPGTPGNGNNDELGPGGAVAASTGTVTAI